MAYVINDGALLRQGWKSTKKHLGFWVLLIISLIVVYIGLQIVGAFIGDSPVALLLWFIAYLAIGMAVYIGLIRVTLQFASGKEANFKDMVNVWDVFLPFFGGMILYTLVMIVGFFLFLIPGVIWSLKFQFVPYLIVDKKMGIMDSFKKSAELTDGLKWDLLGFSIVVSIVELLGYLALFVGAFLTMPTSWIARAALYKKLAK